MGKREATEWRECQHPVRLQEGGDDIYIKTHSFLVSQARLHTRWLCGQAYQCSVTASGYGDDNLVYGTRLLRMETELFKEQSYTIHKVAILDQPCILTTRHVPMTSTEGSHTGLFVGLHGFAVARKP